MTAYLSANLRHTDKRLQQSGPAVVALRHHARARRGSGLMNIHEVGGAMTRGGEAPSAPCWALPPLLTRVFMEMLSSSALVPVFSLIRLKNQEKPFVFSVILLIEGGGGDVIIKIDQLLLTQLYSNDPLKAETRHKRGF